jgi:hypothetical protein
MFQVRARAREAKFGCHACHVQSRVAARDPVDSDRASMRRLGHPYIWTLVVAVAD